MQKFPAHRYNQVEDFDLDKWLEQTAWDKVYWSEIRAWAKQLNSDGCTGVPDWYVWTCYEHDCLYRTHTMLDGAVYRVVTKWEADKIIRVRMQQSSQWGRFYWRAWLRWIGVTLFAQRAWNRYVEPPKAAGVEVEAIITPPTEGKIAAPVPPSETESKQQGK